MNSSSLLLLQGARKINATETCWDGKIFVGAAFVGIWTVSLPLLSSRRDGKEEKRPKRRGEGTFRNQKTFQKSEGDEKISGNLDIFISFFHVESSDTYY